MKHEPLKVVALQKNGKEYVLTTAYNGHEYTHPIEIVDRNGLFGLAMPDELTCILQNEYTPPEAKDFVNKVKEIYLSQNAPVV